ncbi:MAG TPA: hypothetical protein VNK52_00300 [Hyphomicrobiaceae bacterium]|nr:hypothetical protein [Hyphomicrobiaceae bacterium]
MIDTGTRNVLRLNNSRHVAGGGGAPASKGAEPFEAIKEQLIGWCGPWNGLSRRFLAHYFAAVEAAIETAREELSRRLVPFEGLFSYRDWRFSAPKPLPRAFLPVPIPEGASPGSADAHIRVEIAFWLGDRLVAVQSEPSPLTPRAAAEQKARLAGAGIACVGFSTADLDTDGALLERILGELWPAFWSGETLPAGPFRPEVPRPF